MQLRIDDFQRPESTSGASDSTSVKQLNLASKSTFDEQFELRQLQTEQIDWRRREPKLNHTLA